MTIENPRIPVSERRVIHKLINHTTTPSWVKATFEDIKKGDLFILFEADSERVGNLWIATSDSELTTSEQTPGHAMYAVTAEETTLGKIIPEETKTA